MQRGAKRADDLWVIGDRQGHVQSLAEQLLQAGIEGHAPGKDKPLLHAHAPDHPPDPVDVARAIREVIDAPVDERLEVRLRCLTAARTRYSWQHQARELLRVYDGLGF